MKAFLICPVRGTDSNRYKGLIAEFTRMGLQIYCPALDTNQDDPTGLRICEDNLKAMIAADVILVVWDGQSQGVLFDLGMAFVLAKPIMVVYLPAQTIGKSFQNMVMEWQLSQDWHDPLSRLPADCNLHLVKMTKEKKQRVMIASYDEETDRWIYADDPNGYEVSGWL